MRELFVLRHDRTFDGRTHHAVPPFFAALKMAMCWDDLPIGVCLNMGWPNNQCHNAWHHELPCYFFAEFKGYTIVYTLFNRISLCQPQIGDQNHHI